MDSQPCTAAASCEPQWREDQIVQVIFVYCLFISELASSRWTVVRERMREVVEGSALWDAADSFSSFPSMLKDAK